MTSCTDPASEVVTVAMAVLREVFDPASPCPPDGGGTTTVRFFASDGGLPYWDGTCREPFLWVRVQQRYRSTTASFPASFVVKLNNPEQHEEFDKAMIGQPGVRNVLNQKDLVDRLFAVLDGLSNAAFAVALVQAIGAVLLIANMVQVAAYTRRAEIGIMRLVGASRWYTQLPFLVEAVLAALIGVVIAIVGLIVVRAAFLERALDQFYQANLIARIDYADILYISPILLFVGVAMAAVTAYVTLRLYVRR